MKKQLDCLLSVLSMLVTDPVLVFDLCHLVDRPLLMLVIAVAQILLQSPSNQL
jgi:hypothetical protein